MIKLFIDDKRQVPDESWTLVTNVYDALEFIEEHYENISHISFDYYLSENFRHTAMDILSILDPEVFHQPLENYTYHSSDETMNRKMKNYIDELVSTKSSVNE